MQEITLADALAEMRTTDALGKPKPFDVTVVTADRERNTGGELKTLTRARLAMAPVGHSAAVGAGKTVPTVDRENARNPNHRLHGTLNVITGDNDFTKIHVRLITRFNGKQVIW